MDPELISEQDYDFVIRYNKKYKLSAKPEPTVIYTTGSLSLSSIIDFNSYIRFLEKSKKDINPQVYYKYYLNLLWKTKGKNVSAETIEYFTNPATYYKELISFQQFLAIKAPKTAIEIEKYKRDYIQYFERLEIE